MKASEYRVAAGNELCQHVAAEGTARTGNKDTHFFTSHKSSAIYSDIMRSQTLSYTERLFLSTLKPVYAKR